MLIQESYVDVKTTANGKESSMRMTPRPPPSELY